MLSWSSGEAGTTTEAASVATGVGLGDERATALWRFATACAERDDDELVAARNLRRCLRLDADDAASW